MAYHYADLVHTKAFTPKEPQVELLEASWKKNLCVTGGSGNGFICCKLIEHVINHQNDNNYVIYIANSIPAAVRLVGTLRRLTSCDVVEALTAENHQATISLEKSQVIVTTHNHDILSAQTIPVSQISLILCHGCEAAFKQTSYSLISDAFRSFTSSPKLLALAGSILDAVEKPWELETDIEALESSLKCQVDTSSEVVTALKCGVRPAEFLLEYDVTWKPLEFSNVDKEVRDIVEDCRYFLNDHCFDLEEIYGEFVDGIELPMPQVLPLRILDQFEGVLDNLGPWAADKAAYALLRKVENLKIGTPYERHYLLLGLITTTLVKIRAIFEQFFEAIPQTDRIFKFCAPKLIRLFEVVQQFSVFDDDTSDACVVCHSIVQTSRRLDDPPFITEEQKLKLTKRRAGDNQARHLNDSPHALCGLILVNDDLHANVIFQLFCDLKNYTNASYIRACYTIRPTNHLDDPQGLERSYRTQELVLKNFRMRDCNLLIGTSFLETGIDLPKCNLVVRFDLPASFRSYELGKCRARGQESLHLLLVPNKEIGEKVHEIARYHEIEKMLVRRSNGFKESQDIENTEAEMYTSLIKPFCPEMSPTSPKVNLSTAITLLNKYCAKLPSDTFTRLTPQCSTVVLESVGPLLYVSCIRLPINSPMKEEIVGPAMPTYELSRRFAALQCCLRLHSARELDDNLLPISKESFWMKEEEHLASNLILPEDESLKNTAEIRPGTTKRRQYYNKRVATCLTDCRPISGVECFLYSIKMLLTCPLPEEQNTRGRSIKNPEDAMIGFGILTTKAIPNVGAFPIFTRAGEVEVALVLAPERVILEEDHVNKIIHFINYTFTSVLRLQKYLMMFDPEASENSYFVVPTIKVSDQKDISLIKGVNWNFLDLIYRETLQKSALEPVPVFQFDARKYADAVVSPWYRNQDQPQYFYVAETCHDLNPKSDFPGNDYSTFEDYYFSKYGIQIQDGEQALLDVDHTSARLNFLTPRYVNRKGVALPTTSEEKKRARRENLAQKQILVPELCNVHPFPASLWQKAVCLPCILHRLNALLLADEVRRLVATDLYLGNPGDSPIEWGPLDFGWKLADVLAKSKAIVSEPIEVNVPELEPIKTPESCENTDDLFHIGTWDSETYTISGMEVSHLKISKSTESVHDYWDSPMCDDDSDMIEKFGHASDFDSESMSSISTYSSESKSDEGLKIQLLDKDVAEAVESGLNADIRFGEEPEVKWEGSGHTESIGNYSEFKSKYESFLAKESNLIKESSTISCEEPFVLPWTHKPSCDCQYMKDLLTSNNKTPELVDKFVDVASGLKHADFIKQSLMKFEVQEGIKARLCSDGYADLTRDSQIRDDDAHCDVDNTCVFSLNRQPKLEGHPGPSPSLILQALTMSNANDGINLERLETIGDSFLKYAITTYLYCTHVDVHEGKLSHLRSKQVSNLNLYRLGKMKDFAESMVATKFEPHDNWQPPCYYMPRYLERALIEMGIPAASWNRADLPSLYGLSPEEVTNIVRKLGEQLGLLGEGKARNSMDDDSVAGFIPYNLMTQHSIPDKSIADCVEALIGAYLVDCGPRGALLFMSWLGIKVLPMEEMFAATPEELLRDREVGHTAPKATTATGPKAYSQIRFGELSKPPSPLLRYVADPEGELVRLMTGFGKLEEILGYTFKDKSYLLQALTHASYFTNRLTDCYQRLEFLGDAVLDYLITRHLYEDPRHHSPGALTDLRSALVNNTIFASLAVRYEFHKYFRHLCPGLHEVLDRFVRIQEESGHTIHNECYLVEEEEGVVVEDVEVPKALGDIFESVAGAIFLDSGMRLDVVWKVYYNLMKTEIDAFSTNVPKSPIRELLELEPETAQFGKPEKLADGRRVRVAVEVFGKGTFKGIGRNYRIAKCTAAKCALKQLKSRNLLQRKK